MRRTLTGASTPAHLAGNKDVVTWLKGTPFLDQPVSALPSPASRLEANVQASGARCGARSGHDLHYRLLQDLGVQLVGRLPGASAEKCSLPTT